MIKRYEDFVSKDSNGVTFESAKETNCELEDKVCNITTGELSANYANPPIPEGFEYVSGTWNTGLIIRSTVNQNEYVWVPTGILDPNGTLDGKRFNEKFGIRNYDVSKLSEPHGTDSLHDKTFQNQIVSVAKYGGFYISRYNVSVRNHSKIHVMPCVGKTFEEIKEIAENVENTELVKSHLVYGSEYDSVLEWFMQSETLSYAEIVEDSSNWGNYKRPNGILRNIIAIHQTGECEKWFINNIADFAGNVCELTQEKRDEESHIVRGGHYYVSGKDYPVAYRRSTDDRTRSVLCGFRVALWIQ